MIIAWLIGNSIRQARARAELVRAQAAAQTVLAERLRIARELHDMVAHSIGIIAIQAGSGRSVFNPVPAEARDALAAIEATSRETLSGLRRMMTGLRRAEPGSGPGQAPLDPAPGLADLERLAAMTLEAGVQVEVEWLGSREPLPADIDLSAFRIIQEAVTNVVRHARTGAWSGSTSRTGICRSRSPKRPRRQPRPGPATGSPACASAPHCSAATSRQARAPAAASVSPPGCRCPCRPVTIQVILADDQPLSGPGCAG